MRTIIYWLIHQLVLQQFSVICNSLYLANYLLLNAEDKVMVSSKVFLDDIFYEPVMFLSELVCGCWPSSRCISFKFEILFWLFPRIVLILMRKSSKKIQFFIAFLVVSLATSLIVIIFRSEVIKVWLRWIEFLSNVPGLSGLLLLILSPVIFLVVCQAVKRLSQYFSS